jgi:hypothetical protein
MISKTPLKVWTRISSKIHPKLDAEDSLWNISTGDAAVQQLLGFWRAYAHARPADGKKYPPGYVFVLTATLKSGYRHYMMKTNFNVTSLPPKDGSNDPTKQRLYLWLDDGSCGCMNRMR